MFSPLGDTLFATPAIRALGENFPGARILILANPSAAKVLKSNPYGMEVIVARDQWELLKNLAAIRKARYDLALGLSQLGSFLVRFCGALVYFGFYNLASRADRPVTQMCLEVVQRAGCKPGPDRTEFWLGHREEAAAVEKIAGFFKQKKCYGASLVAVHCGGHYFVRKRWPLANFITLAGLLEAGTGSRIVLIGGREDLPNAMIIQNTLPGVINAVGRFKLAETAVLLKNCRLFIGNDSGPLHLAAAVGTPTLGLFGPTSPYQFYPYHPPAHTFIHHAASCSPCYKFGGGLWQQLPKCSRPYCMEAITPAEVAQKSKEQLNLIYNE